MWAGLPSEHASLNTGYVEGTTHIELPKPTKSIQETKREVEGKKQQETMQFRNTDKRVEVESKTYNKTTEEG